MFSFSWGMSVGSFAFLSPPHTPSQSNFFFFFLAYPLLGQQGILVFASCVSLPVPLQVLSTCSPPVLSSLSHDKHSTIEPFLLSVDVCLLNTSFYILHP